MPPAFGAWAKEKEKPPLRWKGNQGFVGSTKAKRAERTEKEQVDNCISGNTEVLVTFTPHYTCTHTCTVILTKLPTLSNLKRHPQVHPGCRPPNLQYLVSQLLGSQCRGHLGSGQEQRTRAGQAIAPAPHHPLISPPVPSGLTFRVTQLSGSCCSIKTSMMRSPAWDS